MRFVPRQMCIGLQPSENNKFSDNTELGSMGRAALWLKESFPRRNLWVQPIEAKRCQGLGGSLNKAPACCHEGVTSSAECPIGHVFFHSQQF